MLSQPEQQAFETSGHRPTWAEVDLDALAANFRSIKSHVSTGVKMMAVVKANAYGHGAVRCAERLAREGADWFGVALPEEGVELRNAGISQPILCLAGFWPGQAAACIQHKLVPVVYRPDMLEALDAVAKASGVVVDAHFKVDTGMGRLGVRFDQLGDLVEGFKKFKNVRIDGLMTHFAAADVPSCEPLTEHQLARFQSMVSLFRDHGYTLSYQHLANSAAIYGQPEAHGNMVRPGGVLYGLWRDILPPDHNKNDLQPVMSLHSRVNLLKWVPQGETIGYGCTFEASRRTLVATIPIGYDDGYMRGLSNRGHVVIRGVYAPVVGRISMDLTIIDVTNIPGVALGDKVTLMGTAEDHSGKKGSLTIPAEDLASIVGTLSYEVTCRISERVPRVYLPPDS